MSKKQMWRNMWLRVRYNLKAYLFFLIVGIMFVFMFVMTMITSDEENIIKGQSIMAVAFTYVPVVIGQAIQPIEYSKCYYLVPRTEAERKQFTIFQNRCKLILGLIGDTILLIFGYLVRPEVFTYLLNWYLLGGVSLVLMTSSSGYSSYYYKRRRSYQSYIISNTITIIIFLIVLYAAMFFTNQKTVSFWTYYSMVTVVVMLIYHIYYLNRYRKTKAEFENIDKEERKLFARTSNCVS